MRIFAYRLQREQWQGWKISLAALGAAILLLGLLGFAPFVVPAAAQAPTTWYVRPDGGSPTQCTGQGNAPYPGTGLAQACAWDHPFRALPPAQTPRIKGGDTLLIAAGSYMLGYGAPETTAPGTCYATGAWDCSMPPIPGGPNSNQPTRILGEGWNRDCSSPPELWGTQRAFTLLNLRGTSNLEVACLEITDHSGCIDGHANPATKCQRETYPFGDWASIGIWAEDSSNVTLRNLNIHGLATTGIVAGRLNNWLVENVRIAANGWVGWDGDLHGQENDSNSGDLRFKRWLVEWNGCAESWPDEQINNCWAQSAGGYGDGVGTGYTGGRWIIEDSTFRYNTSDGLDLLYVDSGAIEVRRSLFVGNAGNQLKTKGPVLVENSILVSNCNFFTDKPFTYHVDRCRADGAALSLTLRRTETATVNNSTIAGQGGCLVTADSSKAPNTNTTVTMRNNIFQGYPYANYTPEQSCLAYHYVWDSSDTSVINFDIDYSIINGVRHDVCPGTVASCNQGAGLQDLNLDTFDARLLAGSPAINRGNPSFAPAHDFAGQIRDNQPDIGAYEWQATTPPTATPTPTVPPTATQIPPAQTPTPTSNPSTPTQTPSTPTRTPIPTSTPTATPLPLDSCVISINNGALYTARHAVTIHANTNTATQIQLSNDGGFVGATWQAYRPTTDWTLPDVGNRIATLLVYAHLRHATGALCNDATLVDSIIFDPLPPSVSANTPVNGKLTVTALDQAEGSGVSDMQLVSKPRIDETLWQPFTGEIDVSQMDNKVVYLYVRDGAGNVSAAAQVDLVGRQLFLPLVTK